MHCTLGKITMKADQIKYVAEWGWEGVEGRGGGSNNVGLPFQSSHGLA